jgi:diacylglycerol kinase family enzyme
MPSPARYRRFFLILNPRAGVFSIERLRGLIARELGGLDVQFYELGRNENIRGVVKSAIKEGNTDIIAAGGDGTVSGVANAVAGTSATLGILPTGTANMLARELGIPLSVTLAAQLIRRGLDIVNIDAMSDGQRNYVYQVIIGTGPEAFSKITRAEKRAFGRSVYALAGLRLLTQYNPIKVRAIIDGREVKMWANQINITSAGILGLAPFRLGPGIRPDDGQVEIIAMRGRTRLEFIDSGLDLMFRNYQKSRGLRYFTARHEISIESEPSTVIKADGEFVGNTPITLRVLPGAVHVYAPSHRGWH